MRGAFRVMPDWASLIRGKRVLLFDDVLTSYAAVFAFTRVLLRAGAAGVDILTIARVS